jgi:hypothetical protein
MLDCSTMPDEGWDIRHKERCYFYPGRDCPGWHEGGICGRILEPIPEDVTKTGDEER